MAQLDTRYINGNAVSWGDFRLIVTLPDMGGMGGRLYGFQSLDFGGEKRDRQPVHGQNEAQAAIALSKGEYTAPNPKIKFLVHTLDADETVYFDSLTTLLAKGAPDGISYGETRMNWLLQVNNKQIRATYQWFDVYCVEPGGTWEKGSEGLTTEVGFTCLRFMKNGKTLYDSNGER